MKSHLRDEAFQFELEVDLRPCLFSDILSVGDSMENCFAGGWVAFSIALIETVFLSAPASADCRARPEFRVGARILAASGVFFFKPVLK